MLGINTDPDRQFGMPWMPIPIRQNEADPDPQHWINKCIAASRILFVKLGIKNNCLNLKQLIFDAPWVGRELING